MSNMIIENVECFDKHNSSVESFDCIDVDTKVWISLMEDKSIAVDAMNCKPGKINEFRRRTVVDVEILYSDLQFYEGDFIDVAFARIINVRGETTEKEEEDMFKERFTKLNDEKCVDTYNDVVMDLDDCINMLNVAETIITGALISEILKRMSDE